MIRRDCAGHEASVEIEMLLIRLTGDPRVRINTDASSFACSEYSPADEEFTANLRYDLRPALRILQSEVIIARALCVSQAESTSRNVGSLQLVAELWSTVLPQGRGLQLHPYLRDAQLSLTSHLCGMLSSTPLADPRGVIHIDTLLPVDYRLARPDVSIEMYVEFLIRKTFVL